MQRIVAPVLIGVLLGVIGARLVFVGSGLSLVPWSIAGVAFGLFARSRPEAMKLGGVYGFALSFVFMLAGYSGDASVLTRLPFFALLGFLGCAAGAVLSLLGRGSLSLLRRASVPGPVRD